MVLLKCLPFLLLIIHQFSLTHGFTEYLLKKCDQAGFCHRNREYSRNIASSSNRYYQLLESSIQFDNLNSTLHGTIAKAIPRADADDIVIDLPFTLSFIQGGSAVRFTIDEVRYRTEAIPEFLSLSRYNETINWALDKNTLHYGSFAKIKKGILWFRSDKTVLINNGGDIKIEIFKSSFLLKVYYKNKLTFIINDRSFLNIEHLRTIEENYKNILPEESTFNMFKDNFQYSKGDTIPFGPESVALDFTFKNFKDVYGIPEHADSLRLRDTTEGEPYRLYNVDVFEYTVGSPSPMYGAVPFMLATNPQSSVGLFWGNAADTWVDIKYTEDDAKTHWISENGVIDVVLFFGETPSDILQKYTDLIGKLTLPSLSSIGYHQCRWNYNDELDVLTVNSEMDFAHIPYDFIWLDLEYTDERKFFTWKPSAFPNPGRLLKKLKQLGRHLVVLIDPHLKRGYEISDAILEKDAAVKNPSGDTFFGQCWPGISMWVDTFNKKAQVLWDSFFEKMVNATNLHIWNDMNEPSIFSGPETTASKDLVHDGGFEERSVHNLYGLTVHESTYKAMKNIFGPESLRPFILTRSFFAGSQRTAATWTGDNMATWDYLRISIPMCLSSNIAGMPFIGADIPGFSGEPEEELIVRWYQAGLWYPFFRGHAHIDAKRREPYLFDEPIKSYVRDAIQLRYSLLPTLYTAFHETSINGYPVMTPMFFEKPQFPEFYDIDDQFYIGTTGIVVKPITKPGISKVEFLLAPGVYYDLFTLNSFAINHDKPDKHTIDADLGKIPVLLEGGHIIMKKDRYRRSSKLLRNDPFTMLIAPDGHGNALGQIYIDDGETFSYQNGSYLESSIKLISGKTITCTPDHTIPYNEFIGNTTIEKIIIAGDVDYVSAKNTVHIIQGNESHIATVIREAPNSFALINTSLRFDEVWEINF